MCCNLHLIPFQVDPYLAISDDFQVFVKPRADLREYGSVADNQMATALLLDLRNKICDTDKILLDTLVQNLSSIVEV